MRTLHLSADDICKGNLILVNAKNPLRALEETGLTPVHPAFSDILMKREAADILKKMFEETGWQNQIVFVSGYRTFAEQTAIYTDSIRENGKTFTDRFVALPGCSEHQTGLAIDLGLKKETIDFICPDFPYEGVCQRFRLAAPQYGFIQRYPKEKEKITGISHEPWHFRYVGYPHSKLMEENGQSLEEYIRYLKNFSQGNGSLKAEDSSMHTEIFYVPLNGQKGVTLQIPENCAYQISGSNTDGFIVTLWRKRYES